jgi:hypothetical protein
VGKPFGRFTLEDRMEREGEVETGLREKVIRMAVDVAGSGLCCAATLKW